MEKIREGFRSVMRSIRFSCNYFAAILLMVSFGSLRENHHSLAFFLFVSSVLLFIMGCYSNKKKNRKFNEIRVSCDHQQKIKEKIKYLRWLILEKYRVENDVTTFFLEEEIARLIWYASKAVQHELKTLVMQEMQNFDYKKSAHCKKVINLANARLKKSYLSIFKVLADLEKEAR